MKSEAILLSDYVKESVEHVSEMKEAEIVEG